jgi:F0F1-type ATP synthase membrane subunit b/b'
VVKLPTQETLQAKAEAEMEMARRKYKEAQESYDSDAMLEAQENLTDAKMKLESAKNFKPSSLQARKK